MSRVPNFVVDATGACPTRSTAKPDILPQTKSVANVIARVIFKSQKRVAAMEGFSESDDYDVVASLSYKRRQLRFILAKVNSVSRHFLNDSGNDIMVV